MKLLYMLLNNVTLILKICSFLTMLCFRIYICADLNVDILVKSIPFVQSCLPNSNLEWQTKSVWTKPRSKQVNQCIKLNQVEGIWPEPQAGLNQIKSDLNWKIFPSKKDLMLAFFVFSETEVSALNNQRGS